jgi:hypothetical protein
MRAIYNAYTEGERQADIAATYGVTTRTISNVLKRQREAGQMASREKIVAGDKRNGRLVSTSDQNRYEGTCVVNGKAKSKSFIAVNAHMAQKAWEKWCQELRDEQAFMDMVERKPKEDEPEVVCGYPSDPIEEIKPTPVPDIKPDCDKVIADTEGENPKLGHWFNDNGSFRVMWMNKPVYLLWARTDKPKCYGVYQSMDVALKELDKLNELSKFLDRDDAFEVEEVMWR